MGLLSVMPEKKSSFINNSSRNEIFHEIFHLCWQIPVAVLHCVHETQSINMNVYFLHLISTGGRSVLVVLRKKWHDREGFYLVMEERAGGNRLILCMVLYLNGLASRFLN